ncbi:MAG: 3-deoxy-8-phosphooctulonate synthase [Myxococcota bacterium]|nr:3-deoxy-8-phosphooctulonate synthase [Myxococcota bacterium]
MHPNVADLFEKRKMTLIAGPCVAESLDTCRKVAEFTLETCTQYGLSYIFKASFDKANRTSMNSYRGPGIQKGLEILRHIQTEFNVPVLTDFHCPSQAEMVAEVVDVLQIPAFLCRQTDLILAAAKTGRPTCIKKGQFLAPDAMTHVTNKFREGGGRHIAVTERGSTFGYDNLVVDMRGFRTMREGCQCPVIFDATHSVQKPASQQDTTGGDRTLAPILARAATAAGIDGLFCEVHPEPDLAKSDGPNSLDFPLLKQTIEEVSKIEQLLRPNRA